MPRRNRNPGSGKAPHNGPATGMGWGGAPRGKGTGGPAFGIEPKPRIAPPITETETELLDEARATWVAVMRDPRSMPMIRMSAAEKLRDDIAGSPVKRVVTPETGASWFVQGEKESESVEAWEAEANLSTARPAGNAD